MELDDFKAAWQSLDLRLQRQHRLDAALFRQGKLDRMQSGLRPLFWGQLVQMLFGLLFILLASVLWSSRPDAIAVIVAGAIVHAYGIATIVCAGVVLARLRQIDHAAPVLDIQKQLAKVRRAYIVSGMVAGLPWWFLWLPVLMVLLGLVGANLFASAPSVVWIGAATGGLGLMATAWLHRWSQHPRRARLAQVLADSATGKSLRKANAQLEELLQFERE